MTQLTVVVGGQFGSEAKGAVVAHLAAEMSSVDTVIRVAGPNAGHTAYDHTGREWKLRSVPVAAVANPAVQLHIAAGSEIDWEVLRSEIEQLEEAGISVTDRLSIHPSATMLEWSHIRMEGAAGLIGRIGSTGKGIGGARADRIMRNARTWGEFAKLNGQEQLTSPPGPFELRLHSEVVIEGTQGYGLGLHTSNYPRVTSSDCRAIDFLAMAGISPWAPEIFVFKVIVVARCFPIRVAGNSGPLKGETTWEALGLERERTTVTNKVRRVGAWDAELLREAIQANGGGDWTDDVTLAITMLDQKFPGVKGATSEGQLTPEALRWLQQVADDQSTRIEYVGTSPTTMFGVDL